MEGQGKRLLSQIMNYFNSEEFILHLGDSIEVMKELPDKSIDLVFADPPYFLSSGGITCQSGEMVSVNKGNWDLSLSVESKHDFNRKWINQCYRLLKDDGTIWISGTLHNIYSIGFALEQEGFRIINNITWQKTNPPPNLACKCFVHSTETILWARKDIKNGKYFFDYKLMKELNNNKQHKDVWTSSLISRSEKVHGKHPTQKPLWLLKKIILASTRPNSIILDPFSGSGTTGIAALELGRKFVGIDSNEDYLQLSIRRKEKAEINEANV